MTMLVPVGHGLWTAEEPVDFYGMRMPHTMTVFKAEDGSLVLHSPVGPSEALTAELAELGEVGAIVSPTAFHDLHLVEYGDRYPGAKVWITPALKSLAARHEVLPAEGRFGDGLEYVRIGGLRIGEYAFFHASSRTLVLADLIFNMGPAHVPPLTGLALRLDQAYGRPAVPLSVRLLAVKDRKRLRGAIARVQEWDFSRVIVGHGAAIDEGAKGAFRAAFRWLG
jgi:hypothetical protein